MILDFTVEDWSALMPSLSVKTIVLSPNRRAGVKRKFKYSNNRRSEMIPTVNPTLMSAWSANHTLPSSSTTAEPSLVTLKSMVFNPRMKPKWQGLLSTLTRFCTPLRPLYLVYWADICDAKRNNAKMLNIIFFKTLNFYISLYIRYNAIKSDLFSCLRGNKEQFFLCCKNTIFLAEPFYKMCEKNKKRD